MRKLNSSSAVGIAASEKEGVMESERNELADMRHGMAILSQQLFCGEREIVITHDGQSYRLSITRQNKLILTK